jgi:trans-aconitate 2-methyltransferase
VAGEEPFTSHFTDWEGPWNYALAEDTAPRLTAAGFSEVSCWLEPKSVSPADPRAFIRTVCLVRHLDRLPAELHGPFIDRVLARAGEPLVLNYVRLNMTATAS